VGNVPSPQAVKDSEAISRSLDATRQEVVALRDRVFGLGTEMFLWSEEEVIDDVLRHPSLDSWFAERMMREALFAERQQRSRSTVERMKRGIRERWKAWRSAK
jgi:hypothetical protein